MIKQGWCNMLQNNKNFINILILFIIMIFVLNGCVYTTSNKSVIDNSYKILKTTQIAYDNAMITAASLYKKGKILDVEKDKIIDLGNDFVKSYKILARVLEMYTEGTDTPISLEQATSNFVEINTKLMLYVGEVVNK
jgi:hypothetical protein